MRKMKLIIAVAALTILCIPLADVLFDSDYVFPIDGVKADITEYTVRLDSTNTPSVLSSEPAADGVYEIVAPSRSVQWLYGPGSYTYENAHFAIGDLYPNTRQFGNLNTSLITGVVEMTVAWTALNGLDPSNIKILFCTPAEGGGMDVVNFVDFEGLTSPHTFTRTDFGDSYKSSNIAFQVSTYAASPDAIFVLNSLEITYDCIPAA